MTSFHILLFVAVFFALLSRDELDSNRLIYLPTPYVIPLFFAKSQSIIMSQGWEIQTAKAKRKPSRKTHAANWTLPSIDFIPPTSDPPNFQQFMLLLCGIPGSGKSTFARALERAMPYKVCYVLCYVMFSIS